MADTLTPEEQQAFLLEKMEEFAERLYRQLQEQAAQKQLNIPAETLRNLSYQVIENNPDNAVEMALSLQDSGRQVDMRRLNFSRNPITRSNNFILAWAQKRGRSFFKKGVPGYTKGVKPGIDEDKQIQRVANAIIFAKGSQKGRKKRSRKRSWSYNKTVYANISRLTDDLLKDQAEFFARGIKADFEENIKLDGLDLS